MTTRSLILALCLSALAPAAALAQAPCAGATCLAKPPLPQWAPVLLPPTYYARPHVDRRPIVAGALLGGLAAFHGINILVGMLGGVCIYDAPGWSDFHHASLVPLAGPWIQLALLPADARDGGWPTFLVISGLAEAALFAAAILALTANEDPPPPPPVYVVPFVAQSGGGAALGGAF